MKGGLYHYVVMHMLDVPDEYPSEDYYDMLEWIDNQGKNKE